MYNKIVIITDLFLKKFSIFFKKGIDKSKIMIIIKLVTITDLG